jgi:1-acyl-sn-glycerol-3-phosphate acyltransferase
VFRRALVATFRSIIRLYFREIERVGSPPDASTRGRVFVSNHHNALVDPIRARTMPRSIASRPTSRTAATS